MLLSCILLACGCELKAEKGGAFEGRDAVVTVVLEHMVRNAAKDTNVVRFVDANSRVILQLKKYFGTGYVIYPMTTAIKMDTGVFVKDSNRVGIGIQVVIEEFFGDKATLIGTYSGAGIVGLRYHLRYIRGTWKIISVENTMSS